VKSNLDICVLIHEFDAAIQALEATSDDAGNNLEDNVIFRRGLFILIDNIFENDSNGSNDSNKECSPSEGSKMESESPLQ